MKIKRMIIAIILLALVCQVNINTINVQAEEAVEGLSQDNTQVITTEENSTEENISVTDIDLGDYESEMQVEDNQVLNITVLPTDATNQEVTYQSSNEEVATINALGRIIAITAGETTITVKSGEIEKKFNLTVNEKEEEKTIPVTEIEVSEFEEEMEIGKTQTITASILPTDATNQSIEYISTNKEVATINSSGKITAIAKGNTTIKIKADEITKELKLTVKVATSKIELDETYVILKVGSSYNIQAQVYPKEAEQTLTYKCTNDKVITVNKSGKIKAQKTGKSSVIISNGDLQKTVTVIVNEKGVSTNSGEDETLVESVSYTSSDELIETMTNSQEEIITIEPKEEKTISKEILKYLYDSKKTLKINCEGYSISINGKEILNYENELSTKIIFEKEKNTIKFIINKNKNLPGKIHLEIADNILEKGKYVYLYNTQKDKYELLNTKIEKGQVLIDITGAYQITNKKISAFRLSIIVVIILIICFLILIGVYIFVKKKHWFW
ncbi:MAG: Ig-like domain-containing protein [Eubacteriaceae bacterium]